MDKIRYQEYECIVCKNKYEARARGKERTPKYCSKACFQNRFGTYVENPNLKRCPKCKTVKPRTDFYQRKDGTLNAYCAPCHSTRTRERRAANPEKTKAERQAYYLANKEYIAAKSAAYARKYPERLREAQKRWAKKNAAYLVEKNRVKRHRRRAGKQSEYTIQEWNDLCARFGNRCVACGSDEKLTVDHVIPLSAGGTSFIENIQPLCHSCNSQKRSQIIDYRLKWKEAAFSV